MIKELYRNMKSELWKMRHTLLLWMHAGIPVLGICVFLAYYSIAAWSDDGKVSGYIQTLSVALPLIISVICAMSIEIEENGRFQTFLGVTVYKSNSLLAKWIVLSGMGFASIVLAVMGFAAGYWMMTGRMVFDGAEYMILAVTMWFGCVNLYLIHLFLNLAFSKSISLCVGTAELLIAALFLTGLGDGRWQLFPCSFSGRWSSFLLTYWHGNGRTPTEYVIKNIEIGFIISVVLWYIIFRWFCFYEGRQCQE